MRVLHVTLTPTPPHTQLRQYSDAIKDQLFVIINRDYRDFITIATKLDGVDTRVEILRRPLLDLRLDLLALHEGLLGSLRSIDSKLHKKSSIRRRKAAVATALQCSALLDSVEEVISSNTSSKSSSSSGGPSRRQLLLSATSATAEATGVNLDTMRASELERAAHALKRAQSCLLSLEEPIAKEEGASAAAQPQREKEGGLSLPAVRVELIARERSLQEQFCRSARGWLDELLNADTVPVPAAAPSVTAEAVVSRPLLHCLRALNAAGRVDVAQQAVDSALMPIVKGVFDVCMLVCMLCASHRVLLCYGVGTNPPTLYLLTRPTAQFSQGRVGGAGGRGSFAGLQECLAAILKTLGARFGAVVAAAEALDAAGAREGGAEGMDLMVRGVWATVTNTLVERFPEMLSIAIPSTLHSCYTCVSDFTEQLPVVLLGRSEESKQRILQHPLVQQLHTRWGLDLYFKMRLTEVSGRVDRACDESSYAFVSPVPVPVAVAVAASSASKTATNGNGSTVKGSVVKNSPTASTSSRIHNGFSTSSCLDVYEAAGSDSTLTPAEVADVRRSTGIDAAGLRVPLCVLVATEMCTCIHRKVCLPVLTERLLGLALRLLVRLEAFVVATADVSTTAYPLGARSLSGTVDGAGMALQVNTADTGVSGAGVGVGAGAGTDVTPTKVALSPPATPTPRGSGTLAMSAGNSASATFVGPTADELVLLASDLLNLEKWLMGSFADAAADVVAAAAAANGAVPKPGTDSKASIKHALQGRATALCLLRNKVLCRVQLMLVHECKLALQGGTGAAVAGMCHCMPCMDLHVPFSQGKFPMCSAAHVP